MNKTAVFGKATVTSSDSSDLCKTYFLDFSRKKGKLLNIKLCIYWGVWLGGGGLHSHAAVLLIAFINIFTNTMGY